MSVEELRAALAYTTLNASSVERIMSMFERAAPNADGPSRFNPYVCEQENSNDHSFHVMFSMEWFQHIQYMRENLLERTHTTHHWPVPDNNASTNHDEVVSQGREPFSPPFLVAAIMGDTAALSEMIHENGPGMAATVQDTQGRAPLHFAAASGHEDCVRLLLAVTGDVNVCDSHGKTPLHFAAIFGHASLVRMLVLELGANPRLCDRTQKWSPLHSAVDAGQTLVVQVLVAECGCWDIIDSRDANQRTPLLITIFKGLDATARMLIELGAFYGLDSTEVLTVRMQSMFTRKYATIRLLADVLAFVGLAKAGRVDEIILALSTGSAVAPIQWVHHLSDSSLRTVSTWVKAALSDSKSCYLVLFQQREEQSVPPNDLLDSGPERPPEGAPRTHFLSAQSLPSDVQRVVASYLVYGVAARRQLRMLAHLFQLLNTSLPPPQSLPQIQWNLASLSSRSFSGWRYRLERHRFWLGPRKDPSDDLVACLLLTFFVSLSLYAIFQMFSIVFVLLKYPLLYE